MATIQNGTVRVENGSVTVRHVWSWVVTNYVALTPGETITYGVGGNGVFLSYVAATQRLKMYRTSGPSPAAGDTVSGATGSADLVQFGPGTPGGWDSGTIGSNPVWFHVPQTPVIYQVSSFDATDALTLSTSYGETTQNDVLYGVTQDYTANHGIPLVANGDVDALGILARAFTDIDSLIQSLTLGELFSLPTSDPGVPGRLWNDSGTVKVSP